MIDLTKYTFWFLTGSQHLYGEETLKQVADHSRKMVEGFNEDKRFPTKIIWKPVLKTSEEIQRILEEANADPACAGVITWMHTFSPLKCGFEVWQRTQTSPSSPYAFQSDIPGVRSIWIL
jgi:L-arabinose isomerase